MELKNLMPWNRPKHAMDVQRGSDPFTALHTRMNQLFDGFLGAAPTPFGIGRGLWGGGDQPSVDVTETAEEIRVDVELPGVREEDVDVTLSGDLLTIRGEKRTEERSEDAQYHQVERTHGSFERSFTLPCEIDQEHVVARFESGVLAIRLPKSAQALKSVVRIEVNKGE